MSRHSPNDLVMSRPMMRSCGALCYTVPFSVCMNRLVFFAIVAAGALFLMCFVVVRAVISV